MSATLAETYFTEREARAHDAAGLFDATRDSGAFVDQLKVWMGRTDLPGRANVDMRYLFRGHADSRWGLSSTLYRTVTSAGGAYDERLTDAPGPYALQAAIASCHARAVRPEHTDWAEIVRLYEFLAEAMPSPIVELNRAVAVSMATGPAAALVLVDQLCDSHALDRYHLLHSARGDLLAKLDRHGEAQTEFEITSSLAQNATERELSAERTRTSERKANAPGPDDSQ